MKRKQRTPRHIPCRGDSIYSRVLCPRCTCTRIVPTTPRESISRTTSRTLIDPPFEMASGKTGKQHMPCKRFSSTHHLFGMQHLRTCVCSRDTSARVGLHTHETGEINRPTAWDERFSAHTLFEKQNHTYTVEDAASTLEHSADYRPA